MCPLIFWISVFLLAIFKHVLKLYLQTESIQRLGERDLWGQADCAVRREVGKASMGTGAFQEGDPFPSLWRKIMFVLSTGPWESYSQLDEWMRQENPTKFDGGCWFVILQEINFLLTVPQSERAILMVEVQAAQAGGGILQRRPTSGTAWVVSELCGQKAPRSPEQTPRAEFLVRTTW